MKSSDSGVQLGLVAGTHGKRSFLGNPLQLQAGEANSTKVKPKALQGWRQQKASTPACPEKHLTRQHAAQPAGWQKPQARDCQEVGVATH